MSDDDAPAQPSRADRLLALVRGLIEYGTRLADALRQHSLAAQSTIIARHFGTTNILLILARITRGLRLAEALEARIVRDTPRLDAEPRPRRAPSHRKSPPAQPATPRPAEAAVPGLDDTANLPTPEQIAAAIRRRPIGAVIADICRDLGILPCHPLWRELSDLVMEYGGNVARLLKDIFDRTLGSLPSAQSLSPDPALAIQSPATSGADPP